MRSPRRDGRALIGIVAAAAIIGLASCSATPTATEPDRLRIGVTGLNANFDQVMSGAGMVAPDGVMATHDPLIAWDRSSSTMDPWLAEEFEVSDDGLTLSLKLREDVDFVDGTHFNADALETYLTGALAIENSTVALFIGPYKPVVTVTGEYTVEITTAQPMRFDFFYLLEEVPMLSPKVLDVPETEVDDPQGSGPYLVEETVADVSMTMVRNPDYWNPEAYPFDEIEFIVFSDEVAALNALKTGQIDATALGLQLAVEAEQAGFTLHEGLGTFGTLYFYDHDGSIVPALGDLRVRQAINMAFDRGQIAETLYLGFGKVSSQPFSSGQAEYIEGGDDFYGYDPERAKELLAEAGYPDGFDLPILAWGTEDIEPIVQQTLADIGINVIYNKPPGGAEWVAAIQSKTEPVILLTHYYTNVVRFFEPAPESFFLKDLEADAVPLDMMSRMSRGTADESAAASQELGNFLLENAWFAPFTKPPAVWATIPGIEIEVGQLLGVPNLREIQLAD